MRLLSLLQLVVAIFAVGQSCLPLDTTVESPSSEANKREWAGMLSERVNLGDIE